MMVGRTFLNDDEGVPYVVEINMCIEEHHTNLRKKNQFAQLSDQNP